ncbi:SDR family NAD(P)-dependent oxidoreductase [Allosphingosinicella vermicomposti]|uniref:SDR family NAD(P)-dependent oxidoreductase n=1 Tax=Allosphingosinicella vermicomposti TaxID=614671 RepID=UPI000D1004FC|nr:SDR family NAD(P)-dependent oxidoreductase [Allosphingosinicella vermicomposti]
MSQFLDGKIAVVTGASRGIGAATAEALAAQGAHVVLTAQTVAGLEEVEDRIYQSGGSATIAPLNLTENDSVARLSSAVAERWGKLDILVLNAAMLGNLMPVAQMDGKEFNKILTLNVIAQQALIAAFDPLLRNSDAGRVIGVTSSVASDPRAFWGAYGASKAAFENLVLSYADEVKNLAPVRAAILDPGATATLMRAKAYPGEDASKLKQPSAVADAIVELLRSDFETGHRLEVR